MENDLVDVVQRVLRHGIQLKERLTRGERFDLRNEQAVLQRLLLTAEEAQRIPEYGLDTASSQGTDASYGAVQGTMERTAPFMGVRYALVSWLDEFFLIDSPWDAAWNENKLEVALYGTNDRAWRFWEQARLAEARARGEALWAFYLCVMLGFRGDLREDKAHLHAWVEAARRRLGQLDGLDWPKPPAREIVTNVPPLYGREALRRMVVACGTLLLVLLPILLWFFIWYLEQTTPVTGTNQRPRAGYGQDLSDSPRKI